MTRFYRNCICFFITSIIVFANTSPVLAVPALPSSFYGIVKYNNANVADGTIVQVFIGNQMIAKGYTEIYQGDSYYVLNIPSDNTETVEIDGGKEGDMVSFSVGGQVALESGIWHSGTNVQLDLTINSASNLEPPLPIPTKLPSQTAIVLIQQPTISATPILIISTTIVDGEITALVVSSSTPEKPEESLPIPGSQVENTNGYSKKVILVIGISLTALITIIFLVWIIRRK